MDVLASPVSACFSSKHDKSTRPITMQTLSSNMFLAPSQGAPATDGLRGSVWGLGFGLGVQASGYGLSALRNSSEVFYS